MIEAILWSSAIILLAGLWGWVAGENEDERILNAVVAATLTWVAVFCFWVAYLGYKVMTST